MPTTAAPSTISTVAPASDLPDNVTVDPPAAAFSIVGAFGATVSTTERRRGGVDVAGDVDRADAVGVLPDPSVPGKCGELQP